MGRTIYHIKALLVVIRTILKKFSNYCPSFEKKRLISFDFEQVLKFSARKASEKAYFVLNHEKLPQIIIGIVRVIYHKIALSALMRTIFSFFFQKLSQCQEKLCKILVSFN